ncbi:unnamed protein product [Closterium sp. NIES-53]
MTNQGLVSGLPSVFLSLPPSLAPPCTPCVAGCLCATPHSSSHHLATAPFQTLHLDSEVTSTLIRWLLATEATRGRRVSRLHPDCGGELRFGILAGFCGEQGISQSWMLPKSPQQNGVAERRIGLVKDIARMSMIHARAPHFLWPYAVRYAAHQLNLQSRVLRPEVSRPVFGPGPLLSACAIPCVFLGFPVDCCDYSFYHPPLHQFLDSRDVRFDESVSYYTRYPCRGLPVPPPPLFLAPTSPRAPAPPVPPLPPGPTLSGDADTGGPGTGGAGSRGARLGGATARGAGAGASGVGGACTESARIGGASAGVPDTGVSSSGASPPLRQTSLDGCPTCSRGAREVGAGATGAVAAGPARAAGGAAGAAAAAIAATTAAPPAAVVPTCEWSSDPRTSLSFTCLLSFSPYLQFSVTSSGCVAYCLLSSSVRVPSSRGQALSCSSLPSECSSLVSCF